MYKRIRICLYILVSFISVFILTNINKVEADYSYCDRKIEDTQYYDCGNYVYTYPEDIIHSSKLISLNEKESIIYVGEIEGVSVFFAKGFKFYNVSFDDRSNTNNNIWSVLKSRGKNLFDGSFNDSWLIDESHQGYYNKRLYADVYTITQYVNDGEKYRTLVVYNVKDDKVNIDDIYYDDINLIKDNNEVLESKKGIKINYSSKYGIKNIDISMNESNIPYTLEGNIYISSEEINKNLLRGETVYLSVTLTDYLNNHITNKYPLSLVNNSVTIKFSTISSIAESSSRRIVVDAIAGKGKTLDADYSWYYWSTSPDDSLIYDDFLKNYASSSYKGSYSEDKGVILRNTSGTYYLYALARDDDTWVVERSEGYTLQNEGYRVTYNIYDYILIVSLLILCIIPVLTYIFISKRRY